MNIDFDQISNEVSEKLVSSLNPELTGSKMAESIYKASTKAAVEVIKSYHEQLLKEIQK